MERIKQINPEALSVDGFDDCIVGIVERAGLLPVLAYDTDACIKVCMDRDGMDLDDANEFFTGDILGAWHGDGTPVFIQLRI